MNGPRLLQRFVSTTIPASIKRNYPEKQRGTTMMITETITVFLFRNFYFCALIVVDRKGCGSWFRVGWIQVHETDRQTCL
jgi:hypothetical protein